MGSIRPRPPGIGGCAKRRPLRLERDRFRLGQTGLAIRRLGANGAFASTIAIAGAARVHRAGILRARRALRGLRARDAGAGARMPAACSQAAAQACQWALVVEPGLVGRFANRARPGIKSSGSRRRHRPQAMPQLIEMKGQRGHGLRGGLGRGRLGVALQEVLGESEVDGGAVAQRPAARRAAAPRSARPCELQPWALPTRRLCRLLDMIAR